VRPDLTLEIPTVSRLGRVHLIGTGGAGMSGIARILLARGLSVSGSDRADSEVLQALRALGATIHVGHVAEHVAGADTLVVSSAVREDNPELTRAREQGLLVLHRSQALAALMRDRRAIAVAGTHGKTTTASLLTVAVRHCGADPSWAVGGDPTDGSPNAHHGGGEIFVAEADESDGSFLLYRPAVAVITNVEPDHLDHYGTPEAVEAAFDAFCDRVEPGGTLVACFDDPGARRVARRAADRSQGRIAVLGYGTAPDADVRITHLRTDSDGVALTLPAAAGGPVQDRVDLRLRVPGEHNARNAAAAWTAATSLGLPGKDVAAGLESFRGTRRRFEHRGTAAGVRVYDDYAHHPTEVRAALAGARDVVGDGCLIAVFQPHLFSRTRIFADRFGQALAEADEVVVLDVYAAREDPEPGVDGSLVSSAVPLPGEQVLFAPEPAAAVDRVVDRARPGDVVVTIGAGDVTRLGAEILRRLGTANPLPDVG
jgi:UDP-N-acetylmuramate--alanine ligase